MTSRENTKHTPAPGHRLSHRDSPSFQYIAPTSLNHDPFDPRQNAILQRYSIGTVRYLMCFYSNTSMFVLVLVFELKCSFYHVMCEHFVSLPFQPSEYKSRTVSTRITFLVLQYYLDILKCVLLLRFICTWNLNKPIDECFSSSKVLFVNRLDIILLSVLICHCYDEY